MNKTTKFALTDLLFLNKKLSFNPNHNSSGTHWYYNEKTDTETMAKSPPEGYVRKRRRKRVLGKKWYYCPQTGRTTQAIPGTEPSGYCKGRGTHSLRRHQLTKKHNTYEWLSLKLD